MILFGFFLTHYNYILISRNPFAICFREAQKYFDNRSNYSSYEERILEVSQHWANSMRIALEDGRKIGGNRFMTIKFEDILKDPEEMIKNICQFVEIDFSLKMLPQSIRDFPFKHKMDEKWYPIRRDVNYKYLRKIKQIEINVISEVCGDVIERFEYTPFDYE